MAGDPRPSVDEEGSDPRPWLIVVCGLPGSGKTTLARRWATDRRAVRLAPDEWITALGADLRDAGLRDRVEALQWSTAEQVLVAGGSVIVEWGTWAEAERESLRVAGAVLGAATELVHLDVDDDELWRRVQARGSDSPRVTRAELVGWREQFETPGAEERARYDRSATLP